jgi:hypothetical protein
MKIIGKILTIGKMMSIIEKDKLPDRDKLRRNRDQKLPGLNELTNKFSFTCTTDPKAMKHAEKDYKKVSREYKSRCKNGEKKTPIECLERYPCFYFTNEPWIEKALKEKPAKSGRKWGDTRVSREYITSLVDALIEKGFSKTLAIELLEESLFVEHRWLNRLYDDAEKNLINKPFTVSSIPKNINEGDLVEYIFIFIKPGVKIGLEEARVIMAQMG